MIKIATHTFNPFGENTYVIYSESKECILVDAGCYTPAEQRTLIAFIEKNDLKPIMALNTHAHIDHICGIDFVKRHWNIPFALHHDDTTILELMPNYAVSMGFNLPNVPSVEIDLAQTSEIKLGEQTLRIIHTPGHTPGGVCIYEPESKILITGDTLFRGSIGRTDLPGGNYTSIMKSIIEQIIPLGDATQIFPGHGSKSSIGHEVGTNPFIIEAIAGQVNYAK